MPRVLCPTNVSQGLSARPPQRRHSYAPPPYLRYNNDLPLAEFPGDQNQQRRRDPNNLPPHLSHRSNGVVNFRRSENVREMESRPFPHTSGSPKTSLSTLPQFLHRSLPLPKSRGFLSTILDSDSPELPPSPSEKTSLSPPSQSRAFSDSRHHPSHSLIQRSPKEPDEIRLPSPRQLKNDFQEKESISPPYPAMRHKRRSFDSYDSEEMSPEGAKRRRLSMTEEPIPQSASKLSPVGIPELPLLNRVRSFSQYHSKTRDFSETDSFSNPPEAVRLRRASLPALPQFVSSPDELKNLKHRPSFGSLLDSRLLNSHQPYARTPELKVSHKLAERKRRREMKELFDELRDSLPIDKTLKTSKWEILAKAIDYIDNMKSKEQTMQKEIHLLRSQIDRLSSLSKRALNSAVKRVEPERSDSKDSSSIKTTEVAPKQENEETKVQLNCS